jgi:HSF-type DNA-binding
MMKMMQYAETRKGPKDDFCVAWLEDGKSFVIRNCDEFTRSVVPMYFKATKFASFTRKLYRWGFRQVNRGIGPDDPIIFGNEHFLRDHPEDMANMKSVTAASARKAEMCGGSGSGGGGDASSSSTAMFSTMMLNPQLIFGNNNGNNACTNIGMKRSFEHVVSEQLHDDHASSKRAFFDNMFQQHGHKPPAPATMQYQQHQQQQQLQPTSLYGVAAQSMNGQYRQNYHLQQQQELQQQQQQQPIKATPYDMMMYNHRHSNNNSNQGNSMLNQFVPQYHPQSNHIQHHNLHPHGSNNNMNSPSQYPSANSTADIVNAAIAALRYA